MSNRDMRGYYQSKNIAQTAQATKHMANDVKQLKEIAKVQTGLLASNLEFTIKNNIELKNINQTLNNIGFVLADLTDSTLRQEQMHKKHYDSIEREKALKEILYNCKKYIEKVKVLNDPIVTACGAKNFLELFNKAGFATKDLSEIADKEYFDERIKDANNEISKLTPEQREELENFEFIYSAYQYILNRDINEDLEQKKELLNEDKYSLISDMDRNPKHSDQVYENRNKLYKNQIFDLTEKLQYEELKKLIKSRFVNSLEITKNKVFGIAILSGLVIFISLYILSDTMISNKKVVEELFIIISGISLFIPFALYRFVSKYLIKTSALKEAERVVIQHENIKKENEEIRHNNEKIDNENKEIIEGRNSKLNLLKKQISSYAKIIVEKIMVKCK